ncbi:efflux RND transporter periplasmic adaptor subunit [Cereibacter sphaeroides]|uniref:efflux RND transporter periplasmic adaptor subunit n=1 Tax=Rhodobacterales TaxID=204455 RepID=UPI000BBE47E3|nr:MULTISPECIES: efflux RND transporter periplasmic adaptor subunit [Paracoccaceae]MCE6950606.1 efflux RND transporter periplasmic adaptor subunit [Cereibacter sphaeroides]MCE6959166.1 efflux RND transporter periplasmic adaptor subunit [Cereibacter sphaeroides]MCE6968407.1 efflux RND transporter periplasmic adaptor subunit [Cereibacter sphaeroides]MCE6974173.1 efflux RND transporter periplasmic adaptor subunit [Cereibacter sphaeroides]
MTDKSDELARILSRRHRARWWIWPLVIVAVLTLGSGVWLARRGSAEVVAYVTEPATRGGLTVTVTATGTVQPTTQVEVSSELSGTIATVDVDYNDEVEVGQVLARLDDTKLKAQLANAEASLAAARGRLEQARATAREAAENYTTRSALDRRGVSAHLDLIASEALHLRAEAEVKIAAADLTLAEANLAVQRVDLAKAVIRSPIRGIVLDRAAEVGQIVASSLNTPVLFTLAEDLTRMELRVDIDEADIGRVRVGNRATFKVDAHPGRNFSAEIVQVRYAPETTEGVVTYKAVLTVDNAERLLRPGMTATATIVVAEVEDEVLVPNAALRFAPPQAVRGGGSGNRGGGLLGLIMPRPPQPADAPDRDAGPAVWVLRGDQPVAVPVTVGETDGRRTAIGTDAIAPGDAVITDQREAG